MSSCEPFPLVRGRPVTDDSKLNDLQQVSGELSFSKLENALEGRNANGSRQGIRTRA